MLQQLRHYDVKNEKQPAGQNLSVILYFKSWSRKNGGVVDYESPSIYIPMASKLSYAEWNFFKNPLSAQAQ